ncbi:Chaperonin Cpn60/TCP-1 family [Trinorchestia longiramus]|nr:Chaperonin Cpn60/TCP-1 family [Trinorchestia longiramus]
MIKLASPNSSTAACSLLRLCQSCKPLAAVAQASFGRRGCAVLMELSGKVILTRDGIDIFKSLLVDDPVVKMAVSHILCFATARGDGSKTCFVLLNRMLFVINDSFFSDNETIFHQPVAASRSRAVKKLQNWRLVVLPTLLRLTVIQYCFATSVRSSKYCEVISSFLKSFLLLRFPQLVANRQLQDSDLRENLAASAVTECRLENPFQFFAALNSTTQLAESILRIDSIIDVKREPKTNNIPFKH